MSYGQYVVPSSDEMINFGVGQPNSDFLPLNLIKEGMKEFINNENDPSILQYGYKAGYKKFRNVLADFITTNLPEDFKISVNPDQLYITNGVTGALSLICSVFGKIPKRGTVMIVEDPSYFLALNIFKEFGFIIETVKIDETYLRQVEKIISKYGLDTYNIFLYTIPTYQNPTNITMTDKMRTKISALTIQYKGFIIIADEVYQFLYFNGLNKPPKPLFYYGGNIISIGSFSKILSPSIRLGWIQTNPKLYKVIDDSGIMESGGALNAISSRIVEPLLVNGGLNTYLESARIFLSTRGNYMYDMSVIYLTPYCDFFRPEGGYFIWYKMKNSKIDTKVMLDYAIKNKVRYHYGSKFSSAVDADRYLRLSFSWYNPEDIKTGIMRLRDTIIEFVHKTNIH
jgi:DNA-binding transcriptional MocR family regulator